MPAPGLRNQLQSSLHPPLPLLPAAAAGELHLRLNYRPFLDLTAAAVHPVRARGVLVVTVRGCRGLVAGDWDGSTDPYVLLKVRPAQLLVQ